MPNIEEDYILQFMSFSFMLPFTLTAVILIPNTKNVNKVASDEAVHGLISIEGEESASLEGDLDLSVGDGPQGIHEPEVLLRKTSRPAKISKEQNQTKKTFMSKKRQKFLKKGIKEAKVQIQRKDGRDPTSKGKDAYLEEFKEIEQKYLEESFSCKVQKEVKYALLDREEVSTGELFVSEGNLRLEMSKPKKSLLIVNTKEIWLIDSFEEIGGKIQILRAKSEEKIKNQPILSLFLGKKSFLEKFDLEESQKTKDQITFVLKPKDNSIQTDKVELVIHLKDREINRIVFEDSLGNQTVLNLSHQKFREKISREVFKFTPPKKSNISDI